MEIDVVIPSAKKDLHKLQSCIRGVIKYSLNPIRNIYVVSNDPDALNFVSANKPVQLINDYDYPFTKNDINLIFKSKNANMDYAHYYFQQLLKLYIFRVIPGLLPNALFVDSDFRFTADIQFINDKNKAFLAFGYPFEWKLNTKQFSDSITHIHIDHAKNFVPDWNICHPYSGMQHHMLFQYNIMEKLFSLVEQKHNKDLWRVFIDCVDIESKKWNAASEYVIYHHFALKYFPTQVYARHLKACDFIYDASDDFYEKILSKDHQAITFQAVGYHAFVALEERIKTMDYIPEELKKDMLAEDNHAFRLTLDDGMLQIHSAD